MRKKLPVPRPETTIEKNFTLSEANRLKLEKLLQSEDEQQDGSKYLGHMRREGDGKFGSFPLYDDYEDEWDSE